MSDGSVLVRKAKLFWCTGAFLLSAVFSVHGLPVGNTAAPKIVQEGFIVPSDCWVDLRVGYEGDFVGDGRLEQEGARKQRVDTFQQYTNAATVTVNILDRLDLFGVFGSSRVCANWRFEDAEDAIARIELETLYQYLWSLGGRGILCEWGKVSLGFGGRYAYANYRPSWLTFNAVPVSVSHTHLQWRAWQLDLDLSYQIDILTPYIGMKYSDAHATLKDFPIQVTSNESGAGRFENRNAVGLFIGCSLSTGKYFFLNIEGRFIDEDAVTIAGDLRF